MNCEEIRDLLAAYALGTATSEEHAQVEAHLDECNLHPELRELRAVSASLALSVPEMAPPDSLKARIMAAASEPQASPVERTTPMWRKLSTAYAIAAVLAIAVVAMTAWNVTLQSKEDTENFVHFFREEDGDWLRLETVLGDPQSRISLGGLDHLDPGKAYQLWAIRGDEVISVGLFNTNPEGRWAGDFEFAFFTGDTIAITIEPEQGSTSPTDANNPIVRTRF